MSWFGVLEHHARRTPDKPLAVFGDDIVTYQADGGLGGGAGRPACTTRGVGAGDVVGLLSYNNIEFLATIFAANYLGAIAMPINWRLAAPELRFILEHSEARALVCDDALVELANEATNDLRRRPRPRVHRRPRRRGVGAVRRPAAARPRARPVRTSRVTTSTG